MSTVSSKKKQIKLEKEMKKAWADWHEGYEKEDLPVPNPSFQRGFYAGKGVLKEMESYGK